MGGGTHSTLSARSPGTGLSPRGRGNLSLNLHGSNPPGSIPAWAGTAFSVTPWISPPRVHPHASGDSPPLSSSSSASSGSPPLVRGQLDIAADLNREGGFTPTRVGTAAPTPVMLSGPAVHPHASGDSVADATQGIEITGSPPREWGQHQRVAGHLGVDGFTPTRVGTASHRQGDNR